MPSETALRHRLLHRIRQRYATTTQEVELGSIRFNFTRVTDPDRVLDDVAAQVDLHERLHGRQAAGQQMHLPYWAELWDSAMGIGLHLKTSEECRVKSEEWGKLNAEPGNDPCRGSCPPILHSALCTLHSASVLDLGCGMGLAGTVAAALGAHVTFADLEPPALLFARLNSLPWRRRVRTRQLNWQTDRLEERFDLIIGADILYEKAQWPFLEPFWRAHLADGGVVLLGEPGRVTGDLFQEWITPLGWSIERAEQAVSTRPKPIRLFKIRLVK